MFGVYFDYKDAGTDIMLCTVIHDGVDVVLQDTKKVAKIDGQTNYESSLEAWKWATQVVLDEDFDEVTFYNQNKLIFDWAVSGKFTAARAHYYKTILGNIKQMVDYGYQAGFEVIKGDKNLAKKYLKKAGTVAAKGSFNNLFSQAKQVQQPTKKTTPRKTTKNTAARESENPPAAERRSVVPFRRKQA